MATTETVLMPGRKSMFPMQRLELGLKALISSSSISESEVDERALHRCLTRTNTFLSSQTLETSLQLETRVFGLDTIKLYQNGLSVHQSCRAQEKGKEVEEEVVVYMSRRQKWRNERRKREFPPPMPMVVKAEKNLACEFPVPLRVLKKYSYSDNGSDEGGGNRVVIIEEKVKHQEYFRVHRANGHLTLQLICVHGDDDENVKEETDKVVLEEESFDVEQEYYETDETKEEEDVEFVEEEPDHHDKGDIDPPVEKRPAITLVSSMPELSPVSKSNGGSASGKCWSVSSSSVRRKSNSDLFRMAIPTIRLIQG